MSVTKQILDFCIDSENPKTVHQIAAALDLKTIDAARVVEHLFSRGELNCRVRVEQETWRGRVRFFLNGTKYAPAPHFTTTPSGVARLRDLNMPIGLDGSSILAAGLA